MDLASFKMRYPSFTDDLKIEQTLHDASLFVGMYEIDADKLELAHALMTAHLLTLSSTDGMTEPVVKRVKADTVEVEFSDKVVAISTWLGSTSYGLQFGLLIRPNTRVREYGVINDSNRLAIRFTGQLTEDLQLVPSEDYYDKSINK